MGQDGLLLDGGYAWPEEGVSELDDSFDTPLDVPFGDYAATITAMDRPTDEYRFKDVDDPEGPIADYVIQLEKVEDFEGVPVMQAIPVLIAFESLSMRKFGPMSRFEENCGEVPAVAIQAVIEGDKLPAPGDYWSGVVPEALYEYVNVKASSVRGLGPEFVDPMKGASFFGTSSEVLVDLAVVDTASAFGAFVAVRSWSRMHDKHSGFIAELRGSVSCAVTVTGPASAPAALASLTDVVDFVSISALPLDAAEPGDDVSDALVGAYAGWLERSDRRDVRYRLAAAVEATEARHRFSQIVQYVEPPAYQLAEWIAADAITRDKALTSWLERPH